MIRILLLLSLFSVEAFACKKWISKEQFEKAKSGQGAIAGCRNVKKEDCFCYDGLDIRDSIIVDRYVDDPEKPIKGFKEAIAHTYIDLDTDGAGETRYTTYSCEDGFELIEKGEQSQCFGIVGYEQKIDGKKLAFDQSLYDARMASEVVAQEESRQKKLHEEKLNEAMRYFLEQAVRTPEGQYLPKEEWQKKLKEAVHGKSMVDRVKEIF